MTILHLIIPAFVATGILSSDRARARSLTVDEADASIEHQLTTATIEDDGRAAFNSSLKYKILNENGRVSYGTLIYKYRAKSADFKVRAAKIMNGGDKISVQSENILDQTVVAGQTGFDDIRQVAVAFPHVRVGSELELELAEKIKRPDVAGHFARRYTFGEYFVAKNVEYRFNSKRPLHFELNDPYGALELIKNEGGRRFHYVLRTKKPIFRKVFDEANALTDDSSQTWAVVSTAPDYQSLFGAFALSYEKAIQSQLPKAFSEMIEQVRAAPQPESQIAQVLATFAERVRYMGDWRAVDGAFLPRSMTAIADSQSGDCKDMSIVVVRMLRELGFKAWVALVHRGPSPPLLVKVPHTGFNHAIVFVQLGEKKFWLDPTNFQSFPDGIFEDIGERQALILDPAALRLDWIRFPQADRSLERVATKVKLRKLSQEVNMKIYHSGAMALHETGSLLRSSRSQFEEATVSKLSKNGSILKYKFDLPQMKSRIVQPLEMQLNFEQHLRPIATSMGPAIEFKMANVVDQLSEIDVRRRIDHFRLGQPYQAEHTVEYTNLRFLGDAVKNCEVKSPWIDFSFAVSNKPARVIRKMTIKKFIIRAAELGSPEFKRFHEQIRVCSRPKTLLYKIL